MSTVYCQVIDEFSTATGDIQSKLCANSLTKNRVASQKASSPKLISHQMDAVDCIPSEHWSDYLSDAASESPDQYDLPPFVGDWLPFHDMDIEVRGLKQAKAIANLPDPLDTPGELESRSVFVGFPAGMTIDQLQTTVARFGDVAETVRYSDAALVRFFDLRAARTMRRSCIIFNGAQLPTWFGPHQSVANPKKPPNNGTIVLFRVPTSVTNGMIAREFAPFGVREVRDTPTKPDQKFVEFWDSRGAEQARRSIDGKWKWGTKIAADFSLPGWYRRMIQDAPKMVKVEPRNRGCNLVIRAG
jgi:hypothetical protein